MSKSVHCYCQLSTILGVFQKLQLEQSSSSSSLYLRSSWIVLRRCFGPS